MVFNYLYLLIFFPKKKKKKKGYLCRGIDQAIEKITCGEGMSG